MVFWYAPMREVISFERSGMLRKPFYNDRKLSDKNLFIGKQNDVVSKEQWKHPSCRLAGYPFHFVALGGASALFFANHKRKSRRPFRVFIGSNNPKNLICQNMAAFERRAYIVFSREPMDSR